MKAIINEFPVGAHATIRDTSIEVWVTAYRMAIETVQLGFRAEVGAVFDPGGEEVGVRVLLVRQHHNQPCYELSHALRLAANATGVEIE